MSKSRITTPFLAGGEEKGGGGGEGRRRWKVKGEEVVEERGRGREEEELWKGLG